MSLTPFSPPGFNFNTPINENHLELQLQRQAPNHNLALGFSQSTDIMMASPTAQQSGFQYAGHGQTADENFLVNAIGDLNFGQTAEDGKEDAMNHNPIFNFNNPVMNFGQTAEDGKEDAMNYKPIFSFNNPVMNDSSNCIYEQEANIVINTEMTCNIFISTHKRLRHKHARKGGKGSVVEKKSGAELGGTGVDFLPGVYGNPSASATAQRKPKLKKRRSRQATRRSEEKKEKRRVDTVDPDMSSDMALTDWSLLGKFEKNIAKGVSLRGKYKKKYLNLLSKAQGQCMPKIIWIMNMDQKMSLGFLHWAGMIMEEIPLTDFNASPPFGPISKAHTWMVGCIGNWSQMERCGECLTTVQLEIVYSFRSFIQTLLDQLAIMQEQRRQRRQDLAEAHAQGTDAAMPTAAPEEQDFYEVDLIAHMEKLLVGDL